MQTGILVLGVILLIIVCGGLFITHKEVRDMKMNVIKNRHDIQAIQDMLGAAGMAVLGPPHNHPRLSGKIDELVHPELNGKVIRTNFVNDNDIDIPVRRVPPPPEIFSGNPHNKAEMLQPLDDNDVIPLEDVENVENVENVEKTVPENNDGQPAEKEDNEDESSDDESSDDEESDEESS